MVNSGDQPGVVEVILDSIVNDWYRLDGLDAKRGNKFGTPYDVLRILREIGTNDDKRV